MKKIITIAIIVILITSGISVTAQQKQQNTKTEKITLSTPIIIEKNDHTYILLKEATTYLNNPGRPQLPIITKTITFPLGTTIENINIKPINIKETKITHEIGYANKAVPQLQTLNQQVKTSKDKELYQSEKLYPNNWCDYNLNIGLTENQRMLIVTIQFYPVRYSPANQIIQYATDAEIQITYNPPEEPMDSANEYDMVIIAPRIFSLQLQRLVKHKNDHGVKTRLITTEHIYRGFEGRDKPEKIKYFIKQVIEEWGINYVLLFGGMKGQRRWTWHVPIRYSNLDDASGFETRYISDLYYADIYKYECPTGCAFDDWDSNGNNIFAEWNKDNQDTLDMYPDVCIGRIPVRYIWEVRNIINRIITYETNTYGQEWFKRMAVVAGDSFDDTGYTPSTNWMEGTEETNLSLTYMPGFDHTRIYVEGGDIDFTTENAINTLSEGHGFVYFTGHGNPRSWATHPHGNFSTWISFDLNSIKQLTNGDKLPVLIVGGCHNAQFDVALSDIIKGVLEEGMQYFSRSDPIGKFWYGEWSPTSWAWLYTKTKQGGSIATIGNTGLGYGTVGDSPIPTDEIPTHENPADGIPDCIQYLGGWLEPHFFKVYNNSIDILGEVHKTALIDYLNRFPINWSMNWVDHANYSELVDCKTVQQWVLLGDPSLKIGGYE